jgi:hypothetical protein
VPYRSRGDASEQQAQSHEGWGKVPLSAGDELSIDEEVEATVRIARHLSAALMDPVNREEACGIRRRLGIQIGLTCGELQLGPTRIVRWLKEGVVVYGAADFMQGGIDRPSVALSHRLVTVHEAVIRPKRDSAVPLTR